MMFEMLWGMGRLEFRTHLFYLQYFLRRKKAHQFWLESNHLHFFISQHRPALSMCASGEMLTNSWSWHTSRTVSTRSSPHSPSRSSRTTGLVHPLPPALLTSPIWPPHPQNNTKNLSRSPRPHPNRAAHHPNSPLTHPAETCAQSFCPTSISNVLMALDLLLDLPHIPQCSIRASHSSWVARVLDWGRDQGFLLFKGTGLHFDTAAVCYLHRPISTSLDKHADL